MLATDVSTTFVEAFFRVHMTLKMANAHRLPATVPLRTQVIEIDDHFQSRYVTPGFKLVCNEKKGLPKVNIHVVL